MHRQVRKAADIYGVAVAVKMIECKGRNGEFVAPVRLQQIDGFRRTVPPQCGQRAPSTCSTANGYKIQ